MSTADKYNCVPTMKNSFTVDKEAYIYFISGHFNSDYELILMGNSFGDDIFWYSVTDARDEILNEMIFERIISGDFRELARLSIHDVIDVHDYVRFSVVPLQGDFKGYWEGPLEYMYRGEPKRIAKNIASDIKKFARSEVYKCTVAEQEQNLFGQLMGYLNCLKSKKTYDRESVELARTLERMQYLSLSSDKSIKRLYKDCVDASDMLEGRRIIDEDR